MGSYLNPSSKNFQECLNSQIYIDKSELIAHMNVLLDTKQKFVCVSRPRRFGKSMAADMLSAYYSCAEDTSSLFDSLKISKHESYSMHLNQHDVLKINMQTFLSGTSSVDTMINRLKKYLSAELMAQHKDILYLDKDNFVQVMMDIFAATNRSFIILIDEWDCLFREYQYDEAAQRNYLDFLRGWLKDQPYVGLAYMTGILPIKKYGTHSALNMFTEYSMTDPGDLAEFFGFTEDEVESLCSKYDMSFEETKAWYDGYRLVNHSQHGDHHFSMYSPKSVVEAMLRHKFGTYWNQTETYEALKAYIQLDMDGLKDAVVKMIGGDSVPINIGTFTNDMKSFSGRDDVLTLLVHLGYLSYDSIQEEVSLPNREVSQEYVNAIRTMDWSEVYRSIEASRNLLQSLWNMDSEAVAAGIEKAHYEISVLEYNDENSLSCTVQLAFYFAREYYTIVREMPSGKGYADICFIPRKLHADKPAVIIELKRDKSAQEAIEQIKQKNYGEALEDYKDNLLLVGINYDRGKGHSCVIEKNKA